MIAVGSDCHERSTEQCACFNAHGSLQPGRMRGSFILPKLLGRRAGMRYGKSPLGRTAVYTWRGFIESRAELGWQLN
jgi:hypothetical protein